MSKTPNILFLMTDQHRWDALGAVNPVVKTPNLDRLAADGVLFSQAVCQCPMCIPSRYSMMSGLYASQIGVRSNGDMIPRDDLMPVPVPAETLQQAGYQTAGFGKTHWYAVDRGGEDVVSSRRGFETRAHARGAPYLAEREPDMLMMCDEDPKGWNQYWKEIEPYGLGGENDAGYQGVTSTVPVHRHREGWNSDKALEFIDSGCDETRPLFLYLSLDAPHSAFNVPPEFEALYDLDEIPDMPQPPWNEPPEEHDGGHLRKEAWKSLSPEERRRTTLRYYAFCSFADAMLGRVVDRMREKGILDNALIMFVSDHGDMLGERQHRFSKYCLYESSVRVPMILSGSALPKSLKGRSDRPAGLIDVLPTLLDAAGLDVPKYLAGESLLKPPVRQGQFCEYFGRENNQRLAYMWRNPEWKLILYLDENGDEAKGELYNLKDDPLEAENLFQCLETAGIREQMTRELLMHLAVSWMNYPQSYSGGEMNLEKKGN